MESSKRELENHPRKESKRPKAERLNSSKAKSEKQKRVIKYVENSKEAMKDEDRIETLIWQ